MLNDQERSLIQRTFAQGPSALFEEGYSEEEVKQFLAREDVRAMFVTLEREMDLQDSLLIRQRYVARRQLNRLSPGAIAVLGQALAGPQYLMTADENGTPVIQKDANQRPIIRRPEPTPTQMRAAEVILESLGVPQQKAKNDGQGATDVNVEILFKGDAKAIVEVEDDPEHVKESQRALSRERVRTVIHRLAQKVPALHNNLRQSLGLPERPDTEEIKEIPHTTKTTKKAAKKKVAKKKAPTKKKAPKKKAPRRGSSKTR